MLAVEHDSFHDGVPICNGCCNGVIFLWVVIDLIGLKLRSLADCGLMWGLASLLAFLSIQPFFVLLLGLL